MGKTSDFVSVLDAPDAVVAELARGLLESEGIPVIMQSFQVPWYNGIMTTARGAWGRLLVPARLAPRAQEILAAIPHDEDAADSGSAAP